MTRKQEQHLATLADRMSKIVGKPCKAQLSDFGNTVAIWIVGDCGALIEKLIGYAPYVELTQQYYVFERAWNMAKHQNE